MHDAFFDDGSASPIRSNAKFASVRDATHRPRRRRRRHVVHTGHPSTPIVCRLRYPNCSAVRASWQGWHRQRMLLSSSLPPCARGTMWSGTVEAVTLPLALQSRHSGSACSLRLRCSTAARPLRRGVSRWRWRRSRGLGNYTPQRKPPRSMFWARRLWVAIPFRTALGANQEHA